MSNFKREFPGMSACVPKYRCIAVRDKNKLFINLRVIATVLSLLLFHIAFAQREKIDSLKKVLPLLHDSARVDCLNEISEAYLKNWNDSARYYAIPAYDEAKKINYIHGMAEALLYKGALEDVADNFAASEKLYREAIYWHRNTPNKRKLADTYSALAFSLYAQSYFAEAIKNFDTAYVNFKNLGDQAGMFWAIYISGHVYEESGNYEKAFELDSKGLELAIQNNNDEFRRYQLFHLAGLFIDIEDYKTASEYFHEACAHEKLEPLYMADIFTCLKQYDSAKYYFDLADTSHQEGLRKYLAITGEYYFAKKEYTKALPNFLRSLEYNKSSNDRNQVMRTMVDVAKTYLALKNNNAAFHYARQGLDLATQTGAKQFIRDANQILYSVYDAKNQIDSAYHYYREYVTMRDSILNDKVKAKLIAYGPQQKIAILNNEKQIQQMQLQKQSLLKNILTASIIILLLLAAVIFRNIILKRRNEKMRLQHELELQRLESEKTKADLQQQATELEMQALRAQMNPHFIFNSLNSINRFILQNNKTEASEYLTKFSKLVRMILQNSQASLITLDSELECLELYLHLEALRFDDHFDYKISVADDVNTSMIKVPPLIIQPYVENAIWHGLMHKDEKGELALEISQTDRFLFLKVTDNGIGRKKASELSGKPASRHKSMGLEITAHRIIMMSTENSSQSLITINDLVEPDGAAAGTEVIIKIPVLYD